MSFQAAAGLIMAMEDSGAFFLRQAPAHGWTIIMQVIGAVLAVITSPSEVVTIAPES